MLRQNLLEPRVHKGQGFIQAIEAQLSLEACPCLKPPVTPSAFVFTGFKWYLKSPQGESNTLGDSLSVHKKAHHWDSLLIPACSSLVPMRCLVIQVMGFILGNDIQLPIAPSVTTEGVHFSVLSVPSPAWLKDSVAPVTMKKNNEPISPSPYGGVPPLGT